MVSFRPIFSTLAASFVVGMLLTPNTAYSDTEKQARSKVRDKVGFYEVSKPNDDTHFSWEAKSPQLHKNIRKSISKKRAFRSADHASCQIAAIESASVHERINLIKQLDSQCIGSTFWTNNAFTKSLYSQSQVAALIQEIQSIVPSYKGESNSGLYQLLEVTRAAYFVADGSSDFNFDDNTQPLRENLVFALEALMKNSHWRLNTEYQQDSVAYEAYYLINNLFLQADLYDELMADLDHYQNNQVRDKLALKNVWIIFDVLSRVQFDGAKSFATSFRNKVEQDNKVIDRIRFWSMDQDVFSRVDYVPHGPIYWLANYILYSNTLRNQGVALAKQVLQQYPVDSEWFLSLIGGYAFDEHCSAIDSQFCSSQYKQQLKNRLYPNTYQYEGSDITIHTALDEARVNRLYLAASQVKSQFFRVTQNTTPVPGDNSDALTIYIAHSSEHYDRFQGYLFNLDSNNGGIYIESDATFYTYERTEEESRFTLEELFRHEYVHYLESRYQIHGSYGEGEFYSSKYEHWEVEGLAEFLSGATASEGVKMRTSIINSLQNQLPEKMSFKEIIESNSGFEVYPYGAVLHHFLYSQFPEYHQQMFYTLRTNDIAGYEALLTQLSQNANVTQRFNAHFDSVLENTENSWNPITPWLVPERLDAKSPATIETAVFEKASEHINCIAIDSSQSVKCTAPSMTSTSFDKFNQTLDTYVNYFASMALNNGTTFSCYGDNISQHDNSIRYTPVCIGYLGEHASIANHAPIVDAGADFFTFDASEITLQAFSFDAEMEPLSLKWTQAKGPSVTFKGEQNAKNLTFRTPLVETLTDIEFTVSASDGTTSSEDKVTIKLMPRSYYAVTKPEHYIYINADYGEMVTIASTLYSPTNQALTYKWGEIVEENYGAPAKLLNDITLANEAEIRLNTGSLDPSYFSKTTEPSSRFYLEVEASDGQTSEAQTIVLDIAQPKSSWPFDRYYSVSVEGNESVVIELEKPTNTLLEGLEFKYKWEQWAEDEHKLDEYNAVKNVLKIDSRQFDHALASEKGQVEYHFSAYVSDGREEYTYTVLITVKGQTDSTSNTNQTNNTGASDSSGGGGSTSILAVLMLALISFKKRAVRIASSKQ
ncbi:collagenase [Aestuariibacter sp. AA17]|uniref:microbial collagenase n=1 Tax=Fluctibacter corallii TaxID=2984329 RepID=A0ABT3A5B5_9ALTE|nr:collagenase [Aestuariibacter sp. AA17]MCV2883838.1 collagenase [Aestuariibacter sp. AA17]